MDEPHLDVVIVGAGLSGIGAAYHLQQDCTDKTYKIIEARGAIGGTWDLFRYPGIRSDSDMYTLGYSFKPWPHKNAMADGASILAYIQEAADENNITGNIQFHTRLTHAAWSSETQSWTLTLTHSLAGSSQQSASTVRCNILSICCGYYDYAQGYTPDFTGLDSFTGQVVHPQHWPEDLAYQDKKVLIIGSGATAMTLAPALSERAAQVTILQRSPSYVVSRPTQDPIARLLRPLLPHKIVHSIVRWKSIALQQMIYKLSRENPQKLKSKILALTSKQLSADYVAKHFTPSYNPWDQRVCAVPDNDLFEAINQQKVTVITQSIDKFIPQGILLNSGQIIEADIIVTATGLNLVRLGGIDIRVDEQPIDFAQTYLYKGVMYSDVPNLINTFGYTNASWTLRSDLISSYLCRLLAHMDKTQTNTMTPRLQAQHQNMPQRDMLDNFSANYIKRHMQTFPKQGDQSPWTNPQDYKTDKARLIAEPVDDGVLIFSHSK